VFQAFLKDNSEILNDTNSAKKLLYIHENNNENLSQNSTYIRQMLDSIFYQTSLINFLLQK